MGAPGGLWPPSKDSRPQTQVPRPFLLGARGLKGHSLSPLMHFQILQEHPTAPPLRQLSLPTFGATLFLVVVASPSLGSSLPLCPRPTSRDIATYVYSQPATWVDSQALAALVELFLAGHFGTSLASTAQSARPSFRLRTSSSQTELRASKNPSIVSTMGP